MDDASLKPATLCLHGGQVPDPATNSRAVPIYQTTSYVFNDTDHAARLFATGRIRQHLFADHESHLRCAWKNAWRCSKAVPGRWRSASGQAAETLAILNITSAGQNMVSSSSLYGGTYNLFHYTFPKMGIDVNFVEQSDPENFRRAIDDNTRCIYLETIGNPRCDVPDFEAISEIAHEAGIPLIVDNTLASPMLCRPFDFGADVVVHSCTKFIGGHGTSIGGIIIEKGDFPWDNGKFPEFTEPDPSYHGMKFSKPSAR